MILLSRSRRRGRKCLQLWQDERVEERLTNCHMRYTWQVAANRLADYESSVGADRTESQKLFVLRLVPVVVVEVRSRWKKRFLEVCGVETLLGLNASSALIGTSNIESMA